MKHNTVRHRPCNQLDGLVLLQVLEEDRHAVQKVKDRHAMQHEDDRRAVHHEEDRHAVHHEEDRHAVHHKHQDRPVAP